MDMEFQMQERDVLSFEKRVDEHLDVVNMPHQPEISGYKRRRLHAGQEFCRKHPRWYHD